MEKKQTNEKPFNFYGARKTKNEKYYSVTLCRGKGDTREWLNVPIKSDLVCITKDGRLFIQLHELAKADKKQEEINDLPFLRY